MHKDEKKDRGIVISLLKKALKPMHEYNRTQAENEKREEYNERKYGDKEKATKTRHRAENKKKDYKLVKVAKN